MTTDLRNMIVVARSYTWCVASANALLCLASICQEKSLTAALAVAGCVHALAIAWSYSRTLRIDRSVQW